MKGRVIGAEQVEAARQRGRLALEILPGDIVTSLAEETAARTGIQLIDGPVEKPAVVRADGAQQLRRGLYRRSPKWVAPTRGAVPRRARRLTKLALVGAGGVGGNLAQLAATADIAHEIALIDIAPGVAASTALDLNHAAGITGATARCIGGADLRLVAGADVVVVSAGRARSPGITRASLLAINKRIVQRIADAISTSAPEAIVIVITNPVDEMTLEMLRATGFTRQRVLGMAGTLDSGRFRHALANAAGVKPSDVVAFTLGSHGDEMVPITSLARIKERPLSAWLANDAIAGCVNDAVTGGGQVVDIKKTGSATIAPAHAAMEVIDHIRGARSGPVPVSVMLQGEYGIKDVVLGVPTHLGSSGLIDVVEWRLSDVELSALKQAANAIRTRLAPTPA